MKISIVTPAFNVAPYIERAIQSVLSQPVDDIEYIIVDGGSTDGTLDIVEKYSDRISRIISEPDEGTYDAVNKGFSMSTGDVMGWIGGDDYYTDCALQTVLRAFLRHPGVEWISSRSTLTANEQGQVVSCMRRGGFSKRAFLDGCYTEGMNSFGTGFINQESTFWRRSLWDKAGGHTSLEWPLAADFELWARFFTFAEIAHLEEPLSVFRMRPNQKSRQDYQAYIDEAREILMQYSKKENHVFHASRPDGLRVYRGNFIMGDRLIQHEFYYLDAHGSLGSLKPLISQDLIA